jgi:predicted AAA+ superfamily ATPase
LDDFIQYGGMPGLIELEGEEQKRKYLKGLFKEYYIGDIIKKHRIKQLDVLEKVVAVLIGRIGSFSTNKEIEEVLKTFNLKVTDDTIGRYVSYTLESFLFMKTKRLDIKNKKYSVYQYKYYCVDHGLRNAMDGLEVLNILNIMRNIIYIELLSRGYLVDVGIVPVKMERSYEVDFIASKGAKIIYIQVAYALESREKVFELTKAFSKIKDNFRKIIVTYDRTKFTTLENGYERIDLVDFLLNTDYLK